MKLSELSKGRDNNFNLLRFIAALLVLVSHSYVLATGDESSEPLRERLQITWGSVAVDIFFITSGFLITKSFVSRRSLTMFFWSRFLRIYPGLFVAVLFCSFFVGVINTNLRLVEYLSHPGLYKFILKNSTVIFGVEYNLPGVFSQTPYLHAVNGSLWTLPFEVRLYILTVLILSFFQWLSTRIKFIKIEVMLAMIILIAFGFNVSSFYFDTYSGSFFKLFFMFFSGSLYFFIQDKVYLSTKPFLVVLLILFLASFKKELFYPCYNLGLAYVVFYLAYIPKGKIRLFNRLGDYSYGLYIYSFPIQQCLVTFLSDINIMTMIIYSFFLSLILAIFSWEFIEKKSLSLKPN